MKLLHVSDLHIGKRVNGMSMLDDQRFILGQIVGIAKREGVAAVLVAGDIYDKASPSAEAVTVFDAFLMRLSRERIRVLAVPGNHDSAERIAYAQGLLANQGVCFPPVYDGRIESVVLHDEHGTVTFWLIPFLKPGDVRRHFPETPIGDDYSAALGAAIGACSIDASQRNVALSHQLVTAGSRAPDRADDEIKLGGIDAVDASLYDAFDYVALGHVHRPQRVGRDTVRYAGSPLKYSFSEARYDKSAVLVELGPKGAVGEEGAGAPGDAAGGCATFKLVDLVPLHDMREVRLSLQELVAQGEALLAAERAAVPPAPAGSDSPDGQAVEAEGGDADAAGGANGAGDADAAGGANGAGEADAAGAVWVDERALLDGAVLQAASERADYLHVTLTDEHPQLDAMAKIRALFPNAMALDYDNAAILAHREKVRRAVDPDALDTVELFAAFYEEQVGSALDEVQAALVEKTVRAVESAFARGADGEGGGAR